MRRGFHQFARTALLGGFALALALGVAGCKPGALGKKKDEAAEDGPRKAVVQAGDFRIEVSATGKVKPVREVEVLSKASGQIIEMPFDLGALVKEGDLLVRLDPQDESRRVKQSEAQLESAKARLAKTRSELELVKSSSKKTAADAEAAVKVAETRIAEATSKYERQSNLFERKLISKEQLEASETEKAQAEADLARARTTLEDAKSLPFQIEMREQDIQLARVDVENAELQLADARRRLDETEIIAPMDGTITDKKVETGRVITSATSGFGGGTIMMTLADLSTLYLVTAVDESDIGGIKLGQRAEITTDAYPGEKFEGEVAHIAPVGLAVSSVVTFDVKVKVLGAGIEKLKPGMTAEVTVITAESPGTMWVQSDAVQREGEGSAFVEKLGAAGAKTKIPVELGLTDGLRLEIKEIPPEGGDLKAGDELLINEEGLSDWEKGEGTNRPMKDMGFGRRPGGGKPGGGRSGGGGGEKKG